MNEDKYICPDCGSSNICKLSIIYRNGISSSEGDASQYQDFLGTNDVRVTAKSQTKASEAAAPPSNPFQTFFMWIVTEIFIFVVFAIIVTMLEYFLKQSGSLRSTLEIICFVLYVLIALIISFSCFSDITTYSSNKFKWNNSYQCQRCDLTFILNF